MQRKLFLKDRTFQKLMPPISIFVAERQLVIPDSNQASPTVPVNALFTLVPKHFFIWIPAGVYAALDAVRE